MGTDFTAQGLSGPGPRQGTMLGNYFATERSKIFFGGGGGELTLAPGPGFRATREGGIAKYL